MAHCIFPFALGNVLGPLLLGPLFDRVGRRRMIALTYALPGVGLGLTGAAVIAGGLDAFGQALCWSVVFFFASAAASSAYLPVGWRCASGWMRNASRWRRSRRRTIEVRGLAFASQAFPGRVRMALLSSKPIGAEVCSCTTRSTWPLVSNTQLIRFCIARSAWPSGENAT